MGLFVNAHFWKSYATVHLVDQYKRLIKYIVRIIN